ncbi:MAG: alpha/beta fold hydrolase [Oscillospiraceae bacterium]|nr:alpha/beta fold hydrolase [Oscillospiraceae bacterium]
MYTYQEFPLVRNGVALHLDCLTMADAVPERHILLIHGVTYSSREFDIDYRDYSLSRLLARNGYAVWSLDIAGYGRSGAVEDGFLPNTDYAAEDICAAVERIVAESGCEKIDLLGWSWGTVTSSRFVKKYPRHIRKLVLVAPILTGVGDIPVTEPFHRNTWAHAAEDFQADAAGNIDLTIVEPIILDMFCSACWRYDGDSSPNGGRRDLLVDPGVMLIDVEAISVPTLALFGDRDPYVNLPVTLPMLPRLPDGSAVECIPGAAHVAMYEKPFYHSFQEKLLKFLNE